MKKVVLVKACADCKIEKSTTEFYIVNKRGSYRSRCKHCYNKWHWQNECKGKPRKEKYPKDPTHNRIRKKYVNSVERAKEDQKIYRSRHPEKYKANYKSRYYLKKKHGYNNHHWSYNEMHFLDTIELLRQDHIYIHAFLEYDKGTYMYKIKSTGELLNTKEKHQKFIDSLLLTKYTKLLL